MTSRRALLAIACLAATLGRPAAAETLEEAWRMALQRDPATAASAADAEAAASGERAARAARLPQLTVSGGYTRYADAPALDVTTPDFRFLSPRIFDDDDTVMGAAELRLPVYTGGSISAGVRAAAAQSRAASAEQRRSVAELRLEVARHYVGVIRARRGLAAAEAAAAALRAHVADVEVMVERETVAISDLLAARVALADAEQSRLRAANGVELAQAAYNRRLGQPLTRVPELDDRIVAPVVSDEGDLGALLSRAMQGRAELEGLDARAEALRARARGETARTLPQVALTAGYSHLETTILDREDFSTVGVGFTWTLFDGGQARHRAAALRRAGQAAELRAADARSGVELEVRSALLALDEARARVRASREAVGQAEENLRVSRELYGAGLATNTQVLDAVARQAGAVANRDGAELDAELARLALARAVGEL